MNAGVLCFIFLMMLADITSGQSARSQSTKVQSAIDQSQSAVQLAQRSNGKTESQTGTFPNMKGSYRLIRKGDGSFDYQVYYDSHQLITAPYHVVSDAPVFPVAGQAYPVKYSIHLTNSLGRTDSMVELKDADGKAASIHIDARDLDGTRRTIDLEAENGVAHGTSTEIDAKGRATTEKLSDIRLRDLIGGGDPNVGGAESSTVEQLIGSWHASQCGFSDAVVFTLSVNEENKLTGEMIAKNIIGPISTVEDCVEQTWDGTFLRSTLRNIKHTNNTVSFIFDADGQSLEVQMHRSGSSLIWTIPPHGPAVRPTTYVFVRQH
jgi:hypothetical protein